MKVILIISLALTTAFAVYKLDYRSFFTDELAYIESGEALLRGDYSQNREVPPIGKYAAGIVYKLAGRNVFLLRLPFALLLPLSAFVAYLIIRLFYAEPWAVLGSALFGWMPFLFTETRMVMLEGPLILFWLLFHLNFLKYLQNGLTKYAAFSGFFLGLSLATKIPSIILPVFVVCSVLLFRIIPTKRFSKDEIKNLIIMSGISLLVYISLLIPQLIREGLQGAALHLKSIYRAYFVQRDLKGKLHFANGVLYLKSPYWYYFHFIKESYNLPLIISSAASPVAALFQKSFFAHYWLLFLMIASIFSQSLGVKQVRYITYLEVPMAFLIVVMTSYLFKKSKAAGIGLAVVLAVSLAATRITYALNESPTGYNLLYNYMREETHNFTTGERIYIYGSIRSSRWYFFGLADNLFVSRKEQKDWDVLGEEMGTFKYLIFDRAEILKKPDNPFYIYAKSHESQYNKAALSEFDIYSLKVDGYRLRL